jgi:hypothetical protein
MVQRTTKQEQLRCYHQQGRADDAQPEEDKLMTELERELLAALEQVAGELVLWGDDSLETFNLTSALEQVLAAIRSAKGEL